MSILNTLGAIEEILDSDFVLDYTWESIYSSQPLETEPIELESDRFDKRSEKHD